MEGTFKVIEVSEDVEANDGFEAKYPILFPSYI